MATGEYHSRHCSLLSRLSLAALSDLGVATAAVDRPVPSRFEGHLSFATTLGTDCGEHLAPWSVAAASRALCFPCFTAGRAALGFVGIASGCVELLLSRSEDKRRSTIGTLERLVRKAHWMTSFLFHSWLKFGHPTLLMNPKEIPQTVDNLDL